jgi:hypothetical protein
MKDLILGIAIAIILVCGYAIILTSLLDHDRPFLRSSRNTDLSYDLRHPCGNLAEEKWKISRISH